MFNIGQQYVLNFGGAQSKKNIEEKHFSEILREGKNNRNMWAGKIIPGRTKGGNP